MDGVDALLKLFQMNRPALMFYSVAYVHILNSSY